MPSIHVIDEQSLGRVDDDAAHGPGRVEGLAVFTDTALDRVGEAQAPLFVHEADVDNLRIEDLLDLVADEVIHVLHVELRGKALLDAVDDRELGSALVRFRQQTLGLVEEARVLKGDRQASCQSRQQPDIALTERILVVHVLKRDNARDRVATDERDEERRFGRLTRRSPTVDPTRPTTAAHRG